MNGGPAFPRAGKEWGDKAWTEAMAEDGMTLRDYFAAKAMQGMMTDPDLSISVHKVAEWAYAQADAMLEARKS